MTETSASPATLHVVATIPIRADAVELARTALAELADASRAEEAAGRSPTWTST